MKNPTEIPLYLHPQNGTSEEKNWIETVGEDLKTEFSASPQKGSGEYLWKELHLCQYHPITKEAVLNEMGPLINQNPRPLHWTIFFEAISRDKNPDGGKLMIGLCYALK